MQKYTYAIEGHEADKTVIGRRHSKYEACGNLGFILIVVVNFDF